MTELTHITQCDDPKYLPFARARIKMMRATGLKYASQKFEVEGVQINVRIEGEHSFVSVGGGAKYMAVFSGVSPAPVEVPAEGSSVIGGKLRYGTRAGRDKDHGVGYSALLARTMSYATTAQNDEYIQLATKPTRYAGGSATSYFEWWTKRGKVDSITHISHTSPQNRETTDVRTGDLNPGSGGSVYGNGTITTTITDPSNTYYATVPVQEVNCSPHAVSATWEGVHTNEQGSKSKVTYTYAVTILAPAVMQENGVDILYPKKEEFRASRTSESTSWSGSTGDTNIVVRVLARAPDKTERFVKYTTCQIKAALARFDGVRHEYSYIRKDFGWPGAYNGVTHAANQNSSETYDEKLMTKSTDTAFFGIYDTGGEYKVLFPPCYVVANARGDIFTGRCSNGFTHTSTKTGSYVTPVGHDDPIGGETRDDGTIVFNNTSFQIAHISPCVFKKDPISGDITFTQGVVTEKVISGVLAAPGSHLTSIIPSADGKRVHLYFGVSKRSAVYTDDPEMETEFQEHLDSYSIVETDGVYTFDKTGTIDLGHVSHTKSREPLTEHSTNRSASPLFGASQEHNGYIWADRFCFDVVNNIRYAIPENISTDPVFDSIRGVSPYQYAYVAVRGDGMAATYFTKEGRYLDYELVKQKPPLTGLKVSLKSNGNTPNAVYAGVYTDSASLIQSKPQPKKVAVMKTREPIA